MTSPRPPLIEMRGLSRTFVNGVGSENTVLDDIDLVIHEGEFVAISGVSGSGKSTLLNILGCLDRPTSGTYRIGGIDVAQLTPRELARLRRETFGFIFQRYHLISGMTAIDNVEVPAIYAGVPRAARRAQSTQLMTLLGLDGHHWKLPWQLSGGQQQRVAVARALINGGSVILADEPTGALDSRNGAEVISIVRELAQTGRTVILVTHDAQTAAQADRTIEISDGRITSHGAPAVARPSSVAHPAPEKADAAGRADSHVPPKYRSGKRWHWAPIAEAARSAFASIRSNRVRTGLTLLGIVIGVASVVALAAIGRGAEADMLERMASLGTNWVIVTDRRDPRMPYVPLSAADAEAIADLPNVRASMPADERWGVVSRGGVETRTEIIGTTRAYSIVYDWRARFGTFFPEEDERRGASIVLLGKTVAEKLFPDIADPSGESVFIERVPFTVAGVLEAKGRALNGEDYDGRVLVPIQSMINRLGTDQELEYIVVELRDMGQIPATREAIRALMIERHGRQDFSLADTVDAYTKASDERTAMNLRLVAIGGISLLVGGIGIMNMMLTGVRERTREIGIRTAAGATAADIMRQFLIEAVVVSSAGGIVGLALGIAIGAGAAYFGTTVILSVTSAALAFLTAVVLGVVFGFMPARHAARLDPVAALASE